VGVAITGKTTSVMMNVNARSGVVDILIDGILHLAQDVADVDQVLLGALGIGR
jgi:hypothetical protein